MNEPNPTQPEAGQAPDLAVPPLLEAFPLAPPPAVPRTSAPPVTERPATKPVSPSGKGWKYACLALVAAIGVAVVFGLVWHFYLGRPNLDGFKSLFNGRDLTGWEGDTNFWSAQNGAIVGRQVSLDVQPGAAAHATLWSETPVEDFELRLRFRGPAPASVWFRRLDRRNGDREGYMAVLDGNLHENKTHSGNRPISLAGRQTVVDNVAGKNSITTLATLASVSQVKAAFRPWGWNEMVLIAETNRFVCMLNGVVTADTTDCYAARFHRSGQLALQFTTNAKKPGQIEFKDIRLKPLGSFPPP
jgi:hypothetical protein